MRRIALWVIIGGLVCGSAWAVNGDMGAGTQPLTDGSVDYPYLIEDVNDFDAFAADSAYWASGVHTQLMTDIDLSGRTYTTAVIAPDYPDTSITTFDGIPFEGVFEGNDFRIRNLNINTLDQRCEYLGLFGYIEGAGAEVKNLAIENINIVGGGESENIGGLCGENYNTSIMNCHATGFVSGGFNVGALCGYNDSGDITNCSSSGAVSGTQNIGGLLGMNRNGGVLINCFSTCLVSADFGVGGLVGNNWQTTIKSCYAEGNVNGTDVIGGLCGVNSGLVMHCYAIGLVNGTGDYVGGLCGFSYSNVTESFFLQSSGLDNGYGTPLDDPNMMIQANFVGWDFSDDDGDPADWMMLRPGEDYPRLAWQEVFSGDIAGLYGADMVDFAYLGQYWGLSGCNSGNDCGRADIDNSGNVGLSDLAAVADDWLK